MFSIFQQISGIIAIVFGFGFVVLPACFSGINIKKQTISMATYKNKYRIIINIGLVLGGFTQIIFLSNILKKYSLSIRSIPSITFLLAASISVFVAFFSIQRTPRIHKLLVITYFVLIPFAEFLIGFVLRSNYFRLYVLSITLITINYLGFAYLIFRYKRKNIFTQLWGFIWQAIWTLVITFF